MTKDRPRFSAACPSSLNIFAVWWDLGVWVFGGRDFGFCGPLGGVILDSAGRWEAWRLLAEG